MVGEEFDFGQTLFWRCRLILMFYLNVKIQVLFQSSNTMQDKKVAEIQRTSMICHAFQIALFLIITLLIMLPLLYHIGTDDFHQDIPHSLDQIFTTPDQQQIVNKLGKKGHRHTILHGPREGGLYEFLQHYADNRAQKGKTVILRKNEDGAFQIAFTLLKQTKNFIEDNLNIEKDQKRVQWVFIVKDGEIPSEQIMKIKEKHPKHRILIGSEEQGLQLEGFKKLQYPGITIQNLEALITTEFQVTPEQAAILVSHYGTIPQIFEHLDQVTYTHKEHLGENYCDIDSLPENDQKILEKLCLNGKAPAKKATEQIEKAGVILYKNKAYWSSRLSILNYELQKLTKCEDIVVSEQILLDIEAKAEEEKAKQAQQQSKKKKAKAKK